jgi:hypothetical protein
MQRYGLGIVVVWWTLLGLALAAEQRHDGLFPVAEVTALIDGRTVIPAHGSREMPIWGARFGEMAGGGPAGEAVVHDVLRMLLDYLQAIQR